MTTQPSALEQVAALARDYRNLDSQRAMLEEQQEHIKERIRDLLDVGDRVDVDGKAVSVQANRRFDAKLAEKELPAELLEMCTVAKVDSSTAKRVLPPALYETFMSEVGKPRVVLG